MKNKFHTSTKACKRVVEVTTQLVVL